MPSRSRTITITVNRKIGDVFEAILNIPPKIMPDAQKHDDGSWSFTTERGPAKLMFSPNKNHGILDHQYVDKEAKWDVPMRVVSSGDNSEVIITLFKPEHFSDQLFDERMKEMEKIMETMKELLEKS